MVLERTLTEGPVAGDPIKMVESEEPIPVRGDELDRGENVGRLLLGRVVGEADPRPPRFQPVVSLPK